MTLKHKLTLALLTSAATVAVLLLAQTPNVQAQGKAAGLTVSGALYGHLTDAGWLADANFLIGNELLPAVILDCGVDGKRGKENSGGGWSGTEHWVVRFQDGSTFEMDATYQASPSSAPGLFTLHETGCIVSGTGRFEHASGHLTVQGPFTVPLGWDPPESDPRQLFWISEIHGTISGIE